MKHVRSLQVWVGLKIEIHQNLRNPGPVR